MAYGVLYEFTFESTNGADCLIQILKKDYTGEAKKRKLGRPPVLKRENNDRIYGTSCEIYAECVEDGEFSQLYTSSPYEFRVEVYRNNQLLWVGFVSPELYSEPDIAPPYDVQIIATDGLGELKDYTWSKFGLTPFKYILQYLLGKSGLIARDYYMVSDLRFRNEDGSLSSPNELLDIKVDLDHEDGENCYDVLQHLLAAFNLNISTYMDKWILFRETDFLSKSQEIESGEFGSMQSCEYWPVGQLSVAIEAAKKTIKLEAPNHYKNNILDYNLWALENNAQFIKFDGQDVLLLPSPNSLISQTIQLDKTAFRLGLKISARSSGRDSWGVPAIGIIIEMLGSIDGNISTYWLEELNISSGNPNNDYAWKDYLGSVIYKTVPYTPFDSSADAKDIDIVLPLYDNGDANFAKADQLNVKIFSQSDRAIYIYDVSLVKYDRIKGYQADIKINNNAREEGSEINLSISYPDRITKNAELFMTGLPIHPSGKGVITSWNAHNGEDEDYLSFMARDYSMAIAQPKMKYTGTLNVPGNRYDLPVLFSRDNTYYFPKTYTFDLYNDELNVELISVSAADVSLESVVISQVVQAAGQTGGSTSGGGSTGGGGYAFIPLDKEMSDTSENAVANRVIKGYVDDKTDPIGIRLDEIEKVTDLLDVVNGALRVKGDIFSTGQFAASIVGQEGGGGGGGAAYLADLYDVSLGSLLSGDILSWNGSEWVNIKQSSLVPDLSGYLPKSGGEISGVSATPLIIKASNTSEIGVAYSMNDATKGWIGYNPTYGTTLYNYASNAYLGIRDNGKAYVNDSEIYHTGNFNPANYLPLTGGTMQGGINWAVEQTSAWDNYFDIGGNRGLRILNTAGYSVGGAPGDYAAALIVSGYYGYALAWDAYYEQLKYRGSGKSDWRTLIHSGNIASQSVAYASNAGLLQGHSLISGTNVYGCIPTVGSDGVMEVGKYLDFHNDSNADSDYDLRLMIEGKYGNTVILPHSNGTLALTTDTVASATRLVTSSGAYMIHLTDYTLYIGDSVYPTRSTNLLGKDIALRYGASATNGLVLNQSGNVTIGESDWASSVARLFVQGKFVAHSVRTNEIRLGDSIEDTSSYLNNWYYASIGYEYTDQSPYTLKPDIVFKTMYETYAENSGEERMRIKANGNILIGSTTDRGHRLTVGRPDGAANLTSTTLNNSLLFVGMSESLDSYGTNFWTEGSGNGFIQQGRTDEEQPALYDLILQPFGRNVGIGTPNPQYALDVVGEARATSLRLNNSSFAGLFQNSAITTGGNSTDIWLQNSDGKVLIYGNSEIGLTAYVKAYSNMDVVGSLIVQSGITTNEITIGGIKLDVYNGALRVNGDIFSTGQFAASVAGEATGGSVLDYASIVNALGYTPANNNNLAQVAFTGSYSSLSGTPDVYTKADVYNKNEINQKLAGVGGGGGSVGSTFGIDYINGQSFDMPNGVNCITSYSEATVNFSSVVPADPSLPCIVYIVKCDYHTLQVTSGCNIVSVNSSGDEVIDFSINGMTGMMLVWEPDYWRWFAYLQK